MYLSDSSFEISIFSAVDLSINVKHYFVKQTMHYSWWCAWRLYLWGHAWLIHYLHLGTARGRHCSGLLLLNWLWWVSPPVNSYLVLSLSLPRYGLRLRLPKQSLVTRIYVQCKLAGNSTRIACVEIRKNFKVGNLNLYCSPVVVLLAVAVFSG